MTFATVEGTSASKEGTYACVGAFYDQMKELFADFEVNRDSRWAVVLRLIGGSLALHALVVASVFYIPGLRDAFSLAILLSDTSFVDRAYQRTEIGDDVQLVELTPHELFRYPEGYWAMDAQPGLAPTTSPSPGVIVPPASTDTPFFVDPAPSPVAEVSPSPLASPSAVANASPVVAGPSVSPSPSPVAKNADEAQKELEKTAAENNLTLPKEGEINKKALKDFAAYANDLKNQGKLDLNKPFEIVIEAELDEHGKLKNAKFTKKEGDPNLVDLFGRMVAALNDSGFLVYLKPIDKDNPGTKVVFTVKQGESEVLASVESEASSVDSAKVLSQGFNAALALGAQSRSGKDEEILLKNTSASPNGKKIIFNFTMPRQAVVDLIKKQLAAS